MKIKIASIFYLLSVLALFFYSFTQIDLSLTFSRIEALRNIVTSFQYVGYFNRPLSAYIFIFILVLLYGFYFYFLKLALSKKISQRTVWKLILVTTGILVFSYNAFSYDLFNYIFDAKIFTHYHQNPYLHKALDFPGDPMLSFMRWTHRVYPYGPVWLLLTIPLSYIGLNLFLPTFFMFKLLIAAGFLGSLYFISKVMQKVSPEKELPAIVFFGLSPFILIESLVSAHLDIVMIFFALWAFYQLVNRKYIFALLLLMVSIGIKFSSAFLIPAFLAAYLMQRRRGTMNWNIIFILALFLNLLTVLAASVYSGNFQPWYLILPMAFAAFFVNRYYVVIPSTIILISALLNYVPYLFIGNWDKPVPQILWNLQIGSIILSFMVVVGYSLLRKHKGIRQ